MARRAPLISGQEVCYVAVKPCGCVIAALIPEFCSNRDIGHRVGPWMRRGWTIERMRTTEARDALTKCMHDQPQLRQTDLFHRRTRGTP
ncbi:MAG TPA: hypothetical protein VK467_02970 [Gemmatimonadales bacterium]|nr:hypothetical protein [Gemmatimonadales bacterium]